MKEALKWEENEGEASRGRGLGNKNLTYGQRHAILMERSPQKWKTSYRDQYRKFCESPGKEKQEQAEEFNV